jgi:hypothetical protein
MNKQLSINKEKEVRLLEISEPKNNKKGIMKRRSTLIHKNQSGKNKIVAHEVAPNPLLVEKDEEGSSYVSENEPLEASPKDEKTKYTRMSKSSAKINGKLC